MGRKTIRALVVVVGAAVIAGAALVGLAIGREPDPLTGDRAADRACEATILPLMGDSDLTTTHGAQVSRSRLLSMGPDERREYVEGITEHSRESHISEIAEAGDMMAVTAGDAGLFGFMAQAAAFGAMADACTSNGWTVVAAREAGLIDD